MAVHRRVEVAVEIPVSLNGVDIIRCDSHGRIVEFQVLLGPLQALNAVHEQMGAVLASSSG